MICLYLIYLYVYVLVYVFVHNLEYGWKSMQCNASIGPQRNVMTGWEIKRSVLTLRFE